MIQRTFNFLRPYCCIFLRNLCLLEIDIVNICWSFTKILALKEKYKNMPRDEHLTILRAMKIQAVFVFHLE